MAGAPDFNEEVRRIVRTALAEDIGSGDITTESTVPSGIRVRASIVAKESCVVCGLDIAKEVFLGIGKVDFDKAVDDGESVPGGREIAVVSGDAQVILKGERTALNFLQRLSGIATVTRKLVEKSGRKAMIMDTRKTTPGLRVIEKYAVRCGGGTNHRKGLYDEILIKDNHISLVGLGSAVAAARKTGKAVEVEARDMGEVREAIAAGADIILLDNMPAEEMAKAVEEIGGRAATEASGGVTEENITEIAATGVDRISVGSLTHSVRSVDIGMYMKKV